MAKKTVKAVKALMSPREARSFNAICKLRSDNMNTASHWLLLNGDGACSVTIAAQRNGQNMTGQVNIPRAAFDRMVDWYTKPQAIRPARREKKK